MIDGSFFRKYRWVIVGVSVAVTLFFALQLPRVRIDPDLYSMIPPGMEARVVTDSVDKIFGGSGMVVILFRDDDILRREDLLRMRAIVRDLHRLKGVTYVMSLFDARDVRGEQGMMIVDPAVPFLPANERERDSLKRILLANDMVRDVVVSSDMTMAAVYVTIGDGEEQVEVVRAIENILSEHPGRAEVALGGMPYLMERISRYISRDISVLMPVALLLMVIMLLLAFRQWRGVVLPFTVVVMTILITMGMLPLLGWKMTIITVLLPIMMIAIANNYGIHLVALYQELNAAGKYPSRTSLVGALFHRLFNPVVLTGLTTVAGILGLLSHILVPARQLGVLAAVGIIFALVLSLFLIPAVMVMLSVPPPERAKGKRGEHPLERGLHRLAATLVQHPGRILVAALLLFLVAAAGITRLQVDANVENFFPEKDPVRQSAMLINEHFGGSQDLSVWFSGDCKDPALLRRLDRYTDTLKKVEGVGQVASLATVVREMSKALYDPGDAGYDRIPDSRNAVAQFFEMYSMGGDPEDFEQLVDFDFRNTRLLIRVKSGSTKVIDRVVEKVHEMVDGDPAFRGIGGYGYINARLSDLILRGQIRSLILAVVVVALLVMLIFRSVRAGLFVTLPLGGAMVLLFGLMGYAGIVLDVATAMLSSIMIGVGVDYTIHFLWRYMFERRRGAAPPEAVRLTLVNTGRGITFNALSVMVGFSALMISSFTPVRFFGFLVVVSIASCLAGAMVLVPALILRYQPKFLEKIMMTKNEK